MEMNNLRAESHVAQQRRRDKLRIQQNSYPTQHLEDYTNSLEQLSVHQGLNPDLIHFRGVKYGTVSYPPSVFPSEMLNYASRNSQVLLAHNDESTAAHPDRQVTVANVSYANLSSHPISSYLNPSAKVSGDSQNCSTWKSIGSQQSCDWIANYSSNPTGIESNPNSMFVGEGLSGSLKPSSYGYQDVQSSLSNPSSEISSQNSQKHYGQMHFNSPPFYQNTLQEVVTSATVGDQGLGMASLAQPNIRDIGRGSWAGSGNDSNELLLLPNYGDQSNPLRINNASAWVNRPVEGCHQWNDTSNAQGLSLSLSSVPESKTHEDQFGGRDDSEYLRSRTGVFNDLVDSKTSKSDYLRSNSKPSIGSKVFGNSHQNMMASTSTFANRSAGPLGPFTGYATILNSSKYLKPTQQLLDEFCRANGPKPIKTFEVYPEKISEEVRVSADAVNANESVVGAKGGDLGASSSTFYSSNEICGDAGGRSSSTESYRPEYQQQKAKLLYMQEEICRRYKQYHQQMQMVVSSFETVAGLGAATPYISLAVKTVSKHFRCLKNAISDQLRCTKKALGEDLPSPTTGTSSSKGDTSTTRLTYVDHSFQKHKSGGSNMGFFEPQQPVWRPQRGLPERAVSILRAWLFDHFLHPYPTDTDKHMLANQTGLTRNQVSNWFINARVRVWKPMVEEIHTLETKGSVEPNSIAGKAEGKPASEVASRPNEDQPTNRLSISSMTNRQVECSGVGFSDGFNAAEHWNQKKRSSVECPIPTSIDGSLMGFVPYQRGGLEMGGLGAVSLTLGLRQSAESAQQQQQLQQEEHQLRQHFGGQMIHDFVG